MGTVSTHDGYCEYSGWGIQVWGRTRKLTRTLCLWNGPKTGLHRNVEYPKQDYEYPYPDYEYPCHNFQYRYHDYHYP